MKKIKLFAMALLAVGTIFSSCSSDDESATGGDIMNRWNPTKTVVKVGSSDSFTQNYNSNEPGCDKDYLEFADNNVLNFVIYFKNAEQLCTPDSAAPATWTKADNTVTISGGSTYDGDYTITRLTSSELRLQNTSSIAGSSTVTTIYFKKAN